MTGHDRKEHYMKPSESEIHAMIDAASKILEEGGINFPHAEGVKMALEWILGFSEPPLDTEEE